MLPLRKIGGKFSRAKKCWGWGLFHLTRPFLKMSCLRRVDSGSFGRRLILFGRNENLDQNQIFALTKLNIYKLSKSQRPQLSSMAVVQKNGK
jgi:hypothetical protein